jgi:hypothetical protein
LHAHVFKLDAGLEAESWWADSKVNLFYVFWRSRVASSSRPDTLFYKIVGENRGEWLGFVPNYSAVTTPPPHWWHDMPAGGLLLMSAFIWFISCSGTWLID